MRLFLKKIVLFLVMQCAIVAVLMVARAREPGGYFAAAIDKHRWAQQQSRPRLLLIGGSNIAFGIASPQLQQAVDYTPVNLALTAGLGLDYILNEAKALIRDDDVVIVSLEYEHFVKDHTSPTHVQMLLDARPESACHFSASQIKTLLDDGLITVHNIFLRALHGDGKSRSAYRRDAFNRFGDVIGHHDKDPLYTTYLKNNPTELHKVKQQHIDEDYLGKVISQLNQFSRQCRRRGVRVYFTYPPLAADAYAIWQQNIARIEQRLQQQLEVPILLQPADVVYPATAFYDTCYHLNADQKSARTRLVAESLQLQWRAEQVAGRLNRHEIRR